MPGCVVAVGAIVAVVAIGCCACVACVACVPGLVAKGSTTGTSTFGSDAASAMASEAIDGAQTVWNIPIVQGHSKDTSCHYWPTARAIWKWSVFSWFFLSCFFLKAKRLTQPRLKNVTDHIFPSLLIGISSKWIPSFHAVWRAAQHVDLTDLTDLTVSKKKTREQKNKGAQKKSCSLESLSVYPNASLFTHWQWFLTWNLHAWETEGLESVSTSTFCQGTHSRAETGTGQAHQAWWQLLQSPLKQHAKFSNSQWIHGSVIGFCNSCNAVQKEWCLNFCLLLSRCLCATDVHACLCAIGNQTENRWK